MITAAVHQAVYDKLTGDASLMADITGVYSAMVQPADPGAVSDFPYITFDVVSTVPNDTDEAIGSRDVFRVHLWWRGRNQKARRLVVDKIRAAMPRDGLTVAGGTNVNCAFQSFTELPDPDGKTVHSIVQFRTELHDIT